MNFKIVVIIICAFPGLIKAQFDGEYVYKTNDNNVGAYFKTDSSVHRGIELVGSPASEKSKVCKVRRGERIIEYTPEEVTEYSFADGRIFFSREIQVEGSSKQVFLERIHNEKYTVYYYKEKGLKTFFYETIDSAISELPRRSATKVKYRKKLQQLTEDCSNVSDACKVVNYNKKSMSKFFSRYDKCELKPFPRFRFGLQMGSEKLRLIKSPSQREYLQEFDYELNSAFTLGLFFDSPLNASDFSLHGEVLYSNHHYSYSKYTGSEIIRFKANLSSIKFPLMIRYSYPSNSIRLFANLGFTLNCLIENETNFEVIGKNIEIEKIVNDIHFGPTIGAGFELMLTYRNSAFFEIRRIRLFGSEEYQFSRMSGFVLLAGINF